MSVDKFLLPQLKIKGYTQCPIEYSNILEVSLKLFNFCKWILVLFQSKSSLVFTSPNCIFNMLTENMEAG